MSDKPELPQRSDIEVCVKCLHTIRPPDQLDYVWRINRWWPACAHADAQRCADNRTENWARHRREIEGRLERGRNHYTHLIVVQDRLGEEFGYGNYYVEVEKGQDPRQVYEDFLVKRESQRGPPDEVTRDILVVSSVYLLSLPIDEQLAEDKPMNWGPR